MRVASAPLPPARIEPVVSEPALTVRQRIVQAITGTLLSARQLAGLLGVPEREIEDHLTHIVKSVARDRGKRFVLDSSKCLDCGFLYRDRTRLTTPSRCPRCRSEAISPPQFGIEVLSDE